MSQTVQELLKQALALTNKERIELAEELYESVDDVALERERAGDPFFATQEIADAWQEELRRREQMLKEGKSKLYTWDEVRAKVREEFGS